MFLDWDVLNITIQALGWALIHFVWQGALVGALFALSSVFLKKARPVARYGVGLLCMAMLAAFPIVTFVIFLEAPGTASEGALATAASSIAPAAGTMMEPVELTFAQSLERFLPWIVAAWMIGVFAHSLRVLLNWRRMRRLTRVGVRQPSPKLLARVEALCRVFGVRQAVRVLESTMIEVPTVLGWLKPVILLPTSSLIGLTPHQLELVIAHELGHVRRWDYLVNLLQVCIETALFYHPVVGWVSRRVREEREKCCDDLVVEHCGNRLEYAKALSNLESIRQGDLSPALAATDGQLFQRIERIVCNHSAEPREAVAGNTLFLVILGAVVLATSQFGDPRNALDVRRDQLADALVSELLIAAVPAHSEALLAPLESARVAFNPPAAEPEESGGNIRAATTNSPAQRDAEPIFQPAATAETAPPVVENTTVRAAATTSRSPVISTADPEERQIQSLSIEPAEHQMQIPTLASIPQSTDTRSGPLTTAAESAATSTPEPESARTQPVAIHRVPPAYPVRARLAGQQGFVEIAFEVSATGRPVNIEIVNSRPRRVFDRAALYALRQWRFDPSSAAGLDVDRFNQRFDFNLSATGSATAGVGECQPLTGTRICRSDSPTALKSLEATSP